MAAALAALMATWAPLIARMKNSLADQVHRLLAAGKSATDDDLELDPGELVADLLHAMGSAGAAAAHRVVEEAREQGVDLHPAAADADRQHAHSAAEQVTIRLRTVAGRAVEQAPEDATLDDTVGAVRRALDGYGDAGPEQLAGNAMHGTMTTARLDTYRQGPVGAIYASEKNDAATCEPCHEVDGRWLGNTDQMDQIALSYPGGALGGYVYCLGGYNCRGTIVGVWRKGTGEEPPVPAAPPEEPPTPQPEPVHPEPAEPEHTPEPEPEPEREEPPAEPEEPAEPTLADHVASGEASSRKLGGGMSAETELVTFNDGAQAVRKRVLNDWIRDPIESADAEELSSILLRRAGIIAPEVHRAAPDTVYMDLLPGEVADEHWPLGTQGSTRVDDEMNAFVSTIAGRRLGLLDLVTLNTDRNSGNWTVEGDLPGAIDHGGNFTEPIEGFTEADIMRTVKGPNNRFAYRLYGKYTPADVETVRGFLDDVRADFVRVGRLAWWDAAVKRLELLTTEARGTEQLWP